jgi:hypothetical protein
LKVCQLRIGDGRDDVHEQSAASLEEMLPRPDRAVVVDDRDHELGFAGAIAEGWRQVRESGCDFVFAVEMDFLFNAPVPIDRMIAVLKRKPYLAQLALKRQPVNEQEREAGGIVEMWPELYRQVTDSGDVFSEHRINWTTNPAVYSTNWCAQEWPQVPGSERVWSDRLLEDPDLRFAYWGAKFDPPMVEHIGVRVGHGY